uniref:Uncharacterized protein n=1 Tax=Arundo donax TaxID=35708 RepID=A0A0A9Q8E1_ARUDO
MFNCCNYYLSACKISISTT